MTVEIRMLRASDDRSTFASGEASLDLFFHRYAGQNQFRHHIGATYVAVDRDHILGFVTVAAGSLDADALRGGRRMPPYPLPVLRVARLAVAETARGRGLGKALLRFCLELAERMGVEYGCVGLVVDAKRGAEDFYRQFGFEEIDVVEGASEQRPRPTPMFLPLGAMPPPLLQ